MKNMFPSRTNFTSGPITCRKHVSRAKNLCQNINQVHFYICYNKTQIKLKYA